VSKVEQEQMILRGTIELIFSQCSWGEVALTMDSHFWLSLFQLHPKMDMLFRVIRS